ncbi:MAG: MBL fold metallo-hydrolase [bacterium]
MHCKHPSSYIKFLGTAGTRFVVSKQIRASGGIWLFLNGIHLHLDPGPGAVVKSIQSHLNPENLSAIILSHRHLDHVNDVNIMIEAMTNGGTNRKGTLFCPQDAIDNDPVVFEYIRNYVKTIEILREGARYRIGKEITPLAKGSNISSLSASSASPREPNIAGPLTLEFDVPVRNVHGSVQAYGIRFFSSEGTIGYIGDTRFFEGLIDAYQGVELLIVNAVVEHPLPGVDHICVKDAITLIKGISPKLAILTHFGLSMIDAQPDIIAEKITRDIQINTIAAKDGMEIQIENRENCSLQNH